MSEAKISANKVVYLTYSILNGEGMVFEQYDLPIGYVHGANSGLFEKIEDALEGHVVGDRVEVLLPPADGFGAHKPELTYTDDIDNVPPEFRRIGAEVQMENENGEAMQFRVTHIENGKLTVDANHPLAGQTATFVVNVVDIRDATREEITNGRPVEAGAPQIH
ncbi:FKBP-type peptidyl-prolyl cis-trans isomerase [Sulfurirhabdus autotrophica]|uniref:peptidylprolyl isomerase n=1 Tax=Sulfurirhabdus autotrophica TaxID=1706046 RepID=A0A4R3XZZ7_9PROT|nr:peptidylprolyl isomerase [Sulfurirhabdus autotrophica]TCV85385.1 FKBP-type peptidyl-prolyl cis-trans isomerase SlyD [Sulfurirhabdus autotrophica]